MLRLAASIAAGVPVDLEQVQGIDHRIEVPRSGRVERCWRNGGAEHSASFGRLAERAAEDLIAERAEIEPCTEIIVCPGACGCSIRFS
jgi:hypothetical protein